MVTVDSDDLVAWGTLEISPVAVDVWAKGEDVWTEIERGLVGILVFS